MTDRFHIKQFYPNYFSFVISGSVALILGAVLPFLIEENGISLAVAGTLLSVFAIGNFTASFVYPLLLKIFGRKGAFVFTLCFQPVCLVLMSCVSKISVLLFIFFMLGLTRGCSSIFNNAYINENGDGSAAALNILHMIFAVGAFSSPLMLSLFVNTGVGWRGAMWTLAFLSFISIFLIAGLKMKEIQVSAKEENRNEKSRKMSFWKNPLFYVTGLLLFFYLGFENCVNGWFVTYFKNSGLMSQTFANSLVSFTWGAVLIGRFSTAILSSRFSKKTLILTDCVAVSLFFVMMISSQSLVLTGCSIVGMGFFLAGIYPTAVSAAGPAINGNDIGMSMLLAIAAFGGIITPQIIGIIGDKTGLAGAIGMLVVNVSAMIILSVLYLLRKEKE